MGNGLKLGVLGTTTIVAMAAATAASAQSRAFAIPEQPAVSGIPEFARQADIQILVPEPVVRSRRTNRVQGTMPVDQGLKRLIQGTGLRVGSVHGRTFTLIARNEVIAEPRQPRPVVLARGEVTRAVAPADRSEAAAEAASTPEIIVTAQKREERLLDVPAPVTALNATRLAENNQTMLRGYADTVPGFTVSPGPSAGNQQMLVIRGVASQAFGNPTVGITVDDVPYGAFVRELAPDIDPSDLARVEVLRGPQGTLYGANSMGGLIKFVTVSPSLDRTSARVELGMNSVAHGDLGFSARAAANFPLSDSLAVRVSAFSRQDAGYVDNPRLGSKDINEGHAAGARLSVQLRPSAAFSLRLSALYQQLEGEGLSEVVAAPGLAPLSQNYLAGVGHYSQRTQAYAANAQLRLGGIDLTSVTGYNVYHSLTSNDYSYLLGGTANSLFGVSGSPVNADTKTRRVTEELRARFFTGQFLEWLVGGFFSHERTVLVQAFNAANGTSGSVVGNIQTLNIPIANTEYAAFGDITLHFSDRFDIQLGGRESHLDTTYEPVLRTGALFPTPSILAGITAKDDVFTYLVTPRFKLSPDVMVYARFASGYRPSRGNSFNPNPAVPRTAQPDTTQNYEIGAKGRLADGLISFEASLYHIDFNDIQILLVDRTTNLTYTTNGSKAKSEGAELSVDLRPWRGMTLSAWGAYNRAVLTEAFPANTAAYGPKGARLPFSPRYSGNVSATQEFPVTPGLTGFVGGTVVYMSSRIGPFIATPARAVYPGYTRVDLRAGLKNTSWSMNLYINNLTDRRVFTGGGAGNFPPTSYVVLQPRTIGFTLAKTF